MATDNRRSQDFKIKHGKETTYGTEVARDVIGKVKTINSPTPEGRERRYENDNETGNAYQKKAPIFLGEHWAWGFNSNIYPDDSKFLSRPIHFLTNGSYTITPSGATNRRLHTFTPQPNQVAGGLSYEVETDASNAYNVLGFIPNSISFNYSARDFAELTIEGTANDVIDEGTVTGNLSGIPALAKYDSSMVDIAIDGVSVTSANYVESFSLNATFGKENKYGLGSNSTKDVEVEGQMEVTGSMRIKFNNDTERDKIISDTKTRIVVTLTHTSAIESTDKYKFVIYTGDVRYTSGMPEAGEDTTRMFLDLEFESNYDTDWNGDVLYAYSDDSGVFTSMTTEVNNASTGDVVMFHATTSAENDAFYLGFYAPFDGINVTMTGGTPGTSGTWGGNDVIPEYYNGSAWVSLNIIEDTTNVFNIDGQIRWDRPTNWATTTVNSLTAVWMRFRLGSDAPAAWATEPIPSAIDIVNHDCIRIEMQNTDTATT